jgi:hypothetical protein
MVFLGHSAFPRRWLWDGIPSSLIAIMFTPAFHYVDFCCRDSCSGIDTSSELHNFICVIANKSEIIANKSLPVHVIGFLYCAHLSSNVTNKAN